MANRNQHLLAWVVVVLITCTSIAYEQESQHKSSEQPTIEDEAEVCTIAGHETDAEQVVPSPNLGGGSQDLSWLFEWRYHSAPITSQSLSADGGTLVTATGSTLLVVNATTGHLKHSLTGHTSNISAVVITPDARTIISASFENSEIRIWSNAGAKPGTCLEVIDKAAQLCNLAIIPFIPWWTRVGPCGKLVAFALSKDGAYIIASYDSLATVFWELVPNKHCKEPGRCDGTSIYLRHDEAFSISIAAGITGYDYNAKYMVARSYVKYGIGNPLVSGVGTHRIRVWHPTLKQVLDTLKTNDGSGVVISSIAVTGNPLDALVAATTPQSLHLWLVNAKHDSSTLLAVHRGERYASVAFSPDGKTLCSVGGFKGDHVLCWNVVDLLKRPPSSEDCTRLIVSSLPRQTDLQTLINPSPSLTYDGNHGGRIQSIVLSKVWVYIGDDSGRTCRLFIGSDETWRAIAPHMAGAGNHDS